MHIDRVTRDKARAAYARHRNFLIDMEARATGRLASALAWREGMDEYTRLALRALITEIRALRYAIEVCS